MSIEHCYLSQPFYLNIAIYKNGNANPCWESVFSGAWKRNEAVKLRKEWKDDLITNNAGYFENILRLDTVRIDTFEFYRKPNVVKNV